MVHMDMAVAILRVLFGKDIPSEPCLPPVNTPLFTSSPGDDKKVLCLAFDKLYLVPKTG